MALANTLRAHTKYDNHNCAAYDALAVLMCYHVSASNLIVTFILNLNFMNVFKTEYYYSNMVYLFFFTSS